MTRSLPLRGWRCAALGALSALASTAAGPTPPCEPHWSDRFAGFDLPLLVVDTLVWLDAPGGGTLYAASSVTAGRPYRWTGSEWEQLPGPYVQTRVECATVYDDGTGPALYIGGAFPDLGEGEGNHLAKWDGQRWHMIGGGTSEEVYSLEVIDDGTGPALYVGGKFERAGGVVCNGIAKWDGQGWTALGSGFTDDFGRPICRDIILYDDGGGPAIYACGRFDTAGGVVCNGIAKWDGARWAAVGGGIGGGSLAEAHDLCVFDGRLYVAGVFATAGGAPIRGVAQWDGSSWSALGEGIDGFGFAMAVFDDGTGPQLYVGGAFHNEHMDPRPGPNLARWDGQSWSSLPGGGLFPGWGFGCRSLLAVGDGPDARLFVGGDHVWAGPIGVRALATYGRDGWHRFGGRGIRGSVQALVAFDDGSGPKVYASGGFSNIDDTGIAAIARWDGRAWSGLEGGPTRRGPDTAVVFDDGSGPALYWAGGYELDGVWRNGGLRWDGRTFTPIPEMGAWSRLYTVFDDGTGPALYGAFDQEPGYPVGPHCPGKWDGTRWIQLGGPITYGWGVMDMIAFDDGSGPSLYAIGQFRAIGDVPAINIARWDGSAWHPVGGGLSDTPTGLAVFDDGSGPALYASGAFYGTGGIPPTQIAGGFARWDGQEWTAVLGPPPQGQVTWGTGPLAVFDDGRGPALYIVGSFSELGGVPARNIIRWDGTSFEPLSEGISLGSLDDILPFDDGRTRSLFFAGDIYSAGGQSSVGIAQWIVCRPCRADRNGDGQLSLDDFMAYLDAYRMRLETADFDGNGVLSLQDFLAYRQAYVDGCP